MIVVVGALAIGGTIAFYNDTETSTGNIFTAGSIDLKVDHTLATYDGEPCVSTCNETGSNLIVNGGFETPVVTDNGGQWQRYLDGSLTSWNVTSGSGLELQRGGVAGAPHSGVQLAELDSDQPNSQSGIAQAVPTVAGGKYRLHFWYSPRPNNGPAGDNAIDYLVKVTSSSGTILTGQVGTTDVGGGGTVWTEYVFDFIAVDGSTTIQFTDAGNEADTLGGYLDDVSLFALNCTETGFPYGGQCHLWNEKDLTQGDTFWNFPDIKPGDYGTNVISLHVTSNDAFACLLVDNVDDQDVTLTDPENDLGDNLSIGELSPLIKVFAWDDANNNGVYNSGETTLLQGNTPIVDIELLNLSLTSGDTEYVGLAWCAGTQPVVPTPENPIPCDGNGMSNIAQTDSFTADLVAYAIQQRNNEDFQCSDVNLDTTEDE